MIKQCELYIWYTDSRSFLPRARQSLSAFDDREDVQELFVAVLMPRYGIDVRLFEYIYQELPKDTRGEDTVRVSEFAATRLLRQLTGLNPKVRD